MSVVIDAATWLGFGAPAPPTVESPGLRSAPIAARTPTGFGEFDPTSFVAAAMVVFWLAGNMGIGGVEGDTRGACGVNRGDSLPFTDGEDTDASARVAVICSVGDDIRVTVD
ncbi:hypothetical protein HZB60_00845 [candidate division KSB1 bacterium]|nr:hypothetical protein [candidate division KSB1 bacterium]